MRLSKTDHRSNDEQIAEDDYAEGHEINDGKCDPRTDEFLKVFACVVWTTAVGDKYRFIALRTPLLSPCEKNMEVLYHRSNERGCGVELGLVRRTALHAFHWETDSYESVNGKDDACPDGSISASVKEKLLYFTQGWVNLLQRYDVDGC